MKDINDSLNKNVDVMIEKELYATYESVLDSLKVTKPNSAAWTLYWNIAEAFKEYYQDKECERDDD